MINFTELQDRVLTTNFSSTQFGFEASLKDDEAAA